MLLTMVSSCPWTPAQLPAELIQYIILQAVLPDTCMRTTDPLPLTKNRFWALRELRDAQRLPTCVSAASSFPYSGFTERSQSCSLKVHSRRNGKTILNARPPGYWHTALHCSQVCRAWRSALIGYKGLWAETVLLMPGHIGLSIGRAGKFPLKLVNHRPLCTCCLEQITPFFSRATDIAFSMQAFTARGYSVSETLYLELLSQSLRPTGISLKYIDVQLSGCAHLLSY